MGELVVVSGPPGAGKSTVAALVADRRTPSALVRGDDFFAFLRRGALAPWLPEADAQNAVVTRAAAAATGVLVRHCDVVYDGVVGPWFLDAFLEGTGLDHLAYVVLLPPLEVCLRRVALRTGHGFTDPDAAARMWHAFADTGLDERHLVRDEGPASCVADLVTATSRSGRGHHRLPPSPPLPTAGP